MPAGPLWGVLVGDPGVLGSILNPESYKLVGLAPSCKVVTAGNNRNHARARFQSSSVAIAG